MKYLITGSNGQLGYDLIKELESHGENEIVGIDRDVDITNRNLVLKKIKEEKPDIIFHCAAWTNVDGAEDNIEECTKVNVDGTKNLIDAAETVEAKLFYISTDYIFDGNKDGIYEIDDIPNPQNIYGKTKFQGEELVKKYPKHFIVRTSWVFGINGHNFIKTMLKLAETKTEINVVKDQIGSPTYTVDLAKLLVDMSNTEEYGTYQANNDGYCSWSELASYIFEINNLPIKINPIETCDYPTKAKRPLNSKLSRKSLLDHHFDRLPAWKDAIERFNQELKKEN